MDFFDTLQHKEIILASQSPRRRELLEMMQIPFKSISLDIDESFSSDYKKAKITEFLAKSKSESFGKLTENQILITADTIVWHNGKCLEKPKNNLQAIEMLLQLSGTSHQVYTSIAVKTATDFQLKTDKTKVFFDIISAQEAKYYVENFNPTDKAGSYGIQDWIGLCKINKIKGSYFTVMGLPTHLLYKMLQEIV